MALTKEEFVVRSEVLANGIIEVCSCVCVDEDGVQISQSYSRNPLTPGSSLEGQDPQVVAIAGAVWTPEIIAAYEASIAPKTPEEETRDE
jgi:hypothetical protein